MKSLILIPAYGRDYKSQSALYDDLKANKDFRIVDYFVIDKSGRAKPDRDWITGPVNRQTLPALKQKAGTDPKKLRQIQEIERLLKISEGG